MAKRIILGLWLLAVGLAMPAAADETEQAAGAELKVTVLDETGAALITASVTLVGPDGVERQQPVDARGEAVFRSLVPGTYQLKADADAFQSFDGPIDLRKGATTVGLQLPLASLNEEVLVTQSTDDVSGHGFTTSLSEQEIAELPDDPDELEQMLSQMAGPGAVFRVDGFRGGRLPPKSQISQIRFRMNSFAAENHESGGFGVDIITRPGMNGWRGMTNFGFRDESLNARNAFAPSLGPEQYRRYGFNSDGPLVKGKTSLSFNVDGNSNYDSRTIVALTPDGPFNGQVRQPDERLNANVRVDHAITNNQTLRVQFRREQNENNNLGVGDFDLPERSYARDRRENSMRVSLNGLIGTRFSHELRVRLEDGRSTTESFSPAPAVVVIDSFSSGGAGQQSDRRSRYLEVEDALGFSIGRKHALRAGLQFELGDYRSAELRNGNGTFTFGSLEAYEQGIATTYTQRVGEALVDNTQAQLGWFIQDDWTPLKTLSLSFGLRHELQSHLDDRWNLAPRVGFTWSPGKITFRGGWGIFYDWYESQLYESVLRVNGVTQQEIVIRNASYPDPTGGTLGEALPPSRLREGQDLRMPYLHQASFGAERTFLENLRLRASYTMQRGYNQFRAFNANAPLTPNGERPDPLAGNITEFESSGRLESDRLDVGINYARPERRFFTALNYSLGRVNNHADSAQTLPANSYDLEAEWGPSARDVRHRLFGMVNFGLPKNFRMGVFGQAQSATPYTIITGFDDNGDTVVNDRPEGVGRNSARGSASFNLNLRLSRSFSFGPQASTDGGPRVVRGGGGGGGGRRGGGDGGPMMMMMDQGGAGRYRVEFYLQAFNVLNRTNLVGYSGNMRSDFFGRATSAQAPRRLELGLSFGF